MQVSVKFFFFAEKCQTLAWFATITKPDTNTDYIFLSVSTIYQDFLQKNLFWNVLHFRYSCTFAL